MEKEKNLNQEGKRKSFWGRFIEKLDQKMQEKAKKSNCCCSSNKKGSDSCCS